MPHRLMSMPAEDAVAQNLLNFSRSVMQTILRHFTSYDMIIEFVKKTEASSHATIQTNINHQ